MELLALSALPEQQSSGLLARISGALSAFSDSDTAFHTFDTLKAMLPRFASALKESEFIVLAIDKAKYNAVRVKLCAALGLRMEQNGEAYRRLSENTAVSPEEKEKNAAVPKNAAVFLTADGMYPGFAVEKGKQTIVFLPLDEERLNSVLKNGAVPYLMQKDVFASDTALSASKTTEQPKTAVSEVVQHTVNILREVDAKAAVSCTPAAEILKALGAGCIDFDNYFIFTPHVEDKGDYNLTDYVAITAKAAKELSGAAYGACISEISRGEGGDYICITVADDKTAVVRKLYREDNESEADFTQDAAEELAELIGEKASGKGAVGIEVAGPAAEPQGFFAGKSGKILLSVIALVLAAAIVVGCIFFVREKKIRDAQNQAQTSAPIPSEIPSVSEPPAVLNTVVLSQLIYNEMLNGVQETPAETTSAPAAGTAIDTTVADPNAQEIPSEMLVNGKTMDAKEAVARMIAAEVKGDEQAEALKAQAVAVYTYLKYRNTNWKITGVTLAEEYSDEVYNAVRAVFGEYLSFGNAPAFTPFCKLSAGRTTAADAVFGQNFPYLRAVDSVSDKTQAEYKMERIYAADDFRDMLTAYDAALTFSENPEEWIQVVRHDGAVNTGIGYVETVSVGGKEISGVEFIDKVMAGKNLPSHCFTVTYSEQTSEFMLEFYGVGHGVGMSLLGADRMAATGSTYAQILSKYYSGTQLTV